MAEERFIQTKCLPPEIVDRIQRKLSNVYAAVQDDPLQVGTLTVRFTVKANSLGDADGDYHIKQEFADRVTSEAGKIRDGQLVLPGTGLRSEEEAGPTWEDVMLAAPAGRR